VFDFSHNLSRLCSERLFARFIAKEFSAPDSHALVLSLSLSPSLANQAFLVFFTVKLYVQ